MKALTKEGLGGALFGKLGKESQSDKDFPVKVEDFLAEFITANAVGWARAQH